MKPFQAAIQEAHAASLMPSYNEVDGIPNHSNKYFLDDILRMILQKHYLGKYSALEFTANSIWFGTALMLPFGSGLVHNLRAAPVPATLAVIYLGIFPGALAYVGWAYVLSHGAAGRTATLLYVIPIVAIGIAWIWLGDVQKWISLVGGAVALCGVVLVNTVGKKKLDKGKSVDALTLPVSKC